MKKVSTNKFINLEDFLSKVKDLCNKKKYRLTNISQNNSQDINQTDLTYLIESGNSQSYLLRQLRVYKHEFGSNGEESIYSILFSTDNFQKLIQSYREISWITYSDDSEDSETEWDEKTTRYSDNSFAKELLESFHIKS